VDGDFPIQCIHGPLVLPDDLGRSLRSDERLPPASRVTKAIKKVFGLGTVVTYTPSASAPDAVRNELLATASKTTRRICGQRG
jgi:hypothetical protein